MAFELPRLPFVGFTQEQFQIWWQQIAEAIEAHTATQDQLIADLATAVADIQAALDAANAAAADAADAQSTADTAKRDDAISASWTSPGAVLSASDAGSNATITIAAHTRKYGDGTQLSVSGDTITNRNYSTTYYVYYNDANRSDTTPNYQSTTNPNTAAPNAGAGRHFVGKIVTPASGGGATSGGTVPPGGGDYSGPGEIP